MNKLKKADLTPQEKMTVYQRLLDTCKTEADILEFNFRVRSRKSGLSLKEQRALQRIAYQKLQGMNPKKYGKIDGLAQMVRDDAKAMKKAADNNVNIVENKSGKKHWWSRKRDVSPIEKANAKYAQEYANQHLAEVTEAAQAEKVGQFRTQMEEGKGLKKLDKKIEKACENNEITEAQRDVLLDELPKAKENAKCKKNVEKLEKKIKKTKDIEATRQEIETAKNNGEITDEQFAELNEKLAKRQEKLAPKRHVEVREESAEDGLEFDGYEDEVFVRPERIDPFSGRGFANRAAHDRYVRLVKSAESLDDIVAIRRDLANNQTMSGKKYRDIERKLNEKEQEIRNKEANEEEVAPQVEDEVAPQVEDEVAPVEGEVRALTRDEYLDALEQRAQELANEKEQIIKRYEEIEKNPESVSVDEMNDILAQIERINRETEEIRVKLEEAEKAVNDVVADAESSLQGASDEAIRTESVPVREVADVVDCPESIAIEDMPQSRYDFTSVEKPSEVKPSKFHQENGETLIDEYEFEGKKYTYDKISDRYVSEDGSYLNPFEDEYTITTPSEFGSYENLTRVINKETGNVKYIDGKNSVTRDVNGNIVETTEWNHFDDGKQVIVSRNGNGEITFSEERFDIKDGYVSIKKDGSGRVTEYLKDEGETSTIVKDDYSSTHIDTETKTENITTFRVDKDGFKQGETIRVVSENGKTTVEVVDANGKTTQYPTDESGAFIRNGKEYQVDKYSDTGFDGPYNLWEPATIKGARACLDRCVDEASLDALANSVKLNNNGAIETRNPWSARNKLLKEIEAKKQQLNTVDMSDVKLENDLLAQDPVAEGLARIDRLSSKKSVQALMDKCKTLKELDALDTKLYELDKKPVKNLSNDEIAELRSEITFRMNEAKGNYKRVFDNNGNVVKIEANGKVYELKDGKYVADDNSSMILDRSSTRFYDSNGRRTQSLNFLGNREQYTYTGDNLTKFNHYGEFEKEFTYDGNTMTGGKVNVYKNSTGFKAGDLVEFTLKEDGTFKTVKINGQDIPVREDGTFVLDTKDSVWKTQQYSMSKDGSSVFTRNDSTEKGLPRPEQRVNEKPAKPTAEGTSQIENEKLKVENEAPEVGQAVPDATEVKTAQPAQSATKPARQYNMEDTIVCEYRVGEHDIFNTSKCDHYDYRNYKEDTEYTFKGEKRTIIVENAIGSKRSKVTDGYRNGDVIAVDVKGEVSAAKRKAIHKAMQDAVTDADMKALPKKVQDIMNDNSTTTKQIKVGDEVVDYVVDSDGCLVSVGKANLQGRNDNFTFTMYGDEYVFSDGTIRFSKKGTPKTEPTAKQHAEQPATGGTSQIENGKLKVENEVPETITPEIQQQNADALAQRIAKASEKELENMPVEAREMYDQGEISRDQWLQTGQQIQARRAQLEAEKPTNVEPEFKADEVAQNEGEHGEVEDPALVQANFAKDVEAIQHETSLRKLIDLEAKIDTDPAFEKYSDVQKQSLKNEIANRQREIANELATIQFKSDIRDAQSDAEYNAIKENIENSTLPNKQELLDLLERDRETKLGRRTVAADDEPLVEDAPVEETFTPEELTGVEKIKNDEFNAVKKSIDDVVDNESYTAARERIEKSSILTNEEKAGMISMLDDAKGNFKPVTPSPVTPKTFGQKVGSARRATLGTLGFVAGAGLIASRLGAGDDSDKVTDESIDETQEVVDNPVEDEVVTPVVTEETEETETTSPVTEDDINSAETEEALNELEQRINNDTTMSQEDKDKLLALINAKKQELKGNDEVVSEDDAQASQDELSNDNGNVQLQEQPIGNGKYTVIKGNGGHHVVKDKDGKVIPVRQDGTVVIDGKKYQVKPDGKLEEVKEQDKGSVEFKKDTYKGRIQGQKDEKGNKPEITHSQVVEFTKAIQNAKTKEDLDNILADIFTFKMFKGRKQLRTAIRAKRDAIKHSDDEKLVAKKNEKIEKKSKRAIERNVDERKSFLGIRLGKKDKEAIDAEMKKLLSDYDKKHKDIEG